MAHFAYIVVSPFYLLIFWSYILSLCLFYARCIDGGIGTGAKCFVCHACSFTTHIQIREKQFEPPLKRFAAFQYPRYFPFEIFQQRFALFSSNLIIFLVRHSISFTSLQTFLPLLQRFLIQKNRQPFIFQNIYSNE